MALGFKQSQSDHSLFIRIDSYAHFVALLVYVDDILIASNNQETVAALKLDLQK